MYDMIKSMLEGYSFWIIVLGVVGMIQRKQEGEPPEWKKRALTKEQQILVNTQYQAYRKEVYKDYPQVERFERNKKRWALLLALLYFITAVLRTFAYGEASGVSGASTAMVISFFFQLCGSLIILGVFLMAMGPKWKFAFLLYVYGIVQLIPNILLFLNGEINSWETFKWAYIEGFKYYPVTVIADLLSAVCIVLILLTAVWLTAFKRNRELAKQSDVLNTQINRDFTPTGI